MSYRINEDCISCGACEAECPNEAISEGETIYIIDSAKCSECVGSHEVSQCAEICPVDACEPDPDKPEDREALLAKWKSLHPGESPAE